MQLPTCRASSRQFLRKTASGLVLLASLALARSAAAFCGFYVTGADSNLYANASMVVLMREGSHTVLSMQNNYEGPPEDFALIVPVPVVLSQEQVKTLPEDVFDRVDRLGAPRLVEYWENDPCQTPFDEEAPTAAGGAGASGDGGGNVVVEAEFAVGEYDVVILSADDAAALENWLRDNDYNIPDGAEAALAPYVEAETKFFVAKVDPERVTFEDGQARLSPLRFDYESQGFSLPIRLGLLNSPGTQDLIVNILARQRYETINYPNVTIPTNIRVQNSVRDDFASFYEALFQRVVEQNPGAVVTEYSWAAQSCDPCPTEPLSLDDLATLGADVILGLDPEGGLLPEGGFVDYTLTRLHYRYTAESSDEDLAFTPARPIIGGRGIPDEDGKLDTEVQVLDEGFNTFQGRYVILHPWTEDIACDDPVRGQWGGPPNSGGGPGIQGTTNSALVGNPASASDDLDALVLESIPSIDVFPAGGAGGQMAGGPSDVGDGCDGCRVVRGDGSKGSLPVMVLVLLSLTALGLRRTGPARTSSQI